jgi:hypothetical protein
MRLPVSMFEDRNRFYRLFHGAPIPVEWQGWQSNTHALHRQGWEITAEEGRDDYSMCHRVRLGLLSPEKTMMIHGLMSVPHTSMYGGSMEEIEVMHRIGFRNMGVIHQRDVHRVMPEREGVSEFLCVRLVQSHPPLGERL